VEHLQTREGFWFNGGLGVGLAGCVGCVGREVGTSGGLSLGGTINERVLLGVGTTGWYKSIDGVALTGGTLDARLRFYPAVRSGFYLTAGGGFGSVAVSNGFLSDRETGVGVLFGLGWDLRVGRNVSLTPFYNGFAMGVNSGTFFVDQFGLGVTIHWRVLLNETIFQGGLLESAFLLRDLSLSRERTRAVTTVTESRTHDDDDGMR
jgi:hypothetical protein